MGWGGAGVRPPGRVGVYAERAANAFIGRWEKLRCLYSSMDRTHPGARVWAMGHCNIDTRSGFS